MSRGFSRFRQYRLIIYFLQLVPTHDNAAAKVDYRYSLPDAGRAK